MTPAPPAHKPYYDITKAAGSFANIASVLAGFAFAAVVLIGQSDYARDASNAYLRDQVTTSFLLSLAGFIAVAAVFALISGEEELTARSYAMGFFGSLGFALSTTYLFWGLVILMKVFLPLSAGTESFTIWLFGGVVWLTSTYLFGSVFDAYLRFDQLPFQQIPRNRRNLFLVSTYLPLVIGLIAKACFPWPWQALLSPYFHLLLIGSYLFILFGAVWPIVVGKYSPDYHNDARLVSACLFLQASIAAVLFLTV